MKTEFVCENCGYIASKWYGKCPQCSEWNTFSERENDVEPTKVSVLGRIHPPLLNNQKLVKLKNKHRYRRV